jgi:hypothetical protein
MNQALLQGPRNFDLTELALLADRARRFRRVASNSILGVGFALILIGSYFFFGPPPGSIPAYSSGPILFIAIGVIIVGYASWVVRGLGPSPRRLVLSRSSVSFEDIPGRPPICVDWNRHGLRLDLYDLREIRKAKPESRSRGYEFLVQPSGGPEAAIPPEAYEAIIQVAEEHGLQVSKRSVPSGAGAPMLITTIRFAR